MAGDGYGYARIVSASYDLSNMPLWPRLYLQGDYERATILLSPRRDPGDIDPPQQITLAVTLRRADLFSLVYQGETIMRRVLGLSWQDYGAGLEAEETERRLEVAALFPLRPATTKAPVRRGRTSPEAAPVSEARKRIAAIARRVIVRDDSDGRKYREDTAI
jgi:hypothetical protein